jgi:hypothetical protein
LMSAAAAAAAADVALQHRSVVCMQLSDACGAAAVSVALCAQEVYDNRGMVAAAALFPQ